MNAVITAPSTDNMDAALAYAAIGWHVIPCWWIRADKTCACTNINCTSPGKHPLSSLVPKGQHSASTDPAVIADWWGRFPHANIATYLAPSNLCAVDIDPRNGGDGGIEALEAAHGPVASDWLQFTGGGGEHRVFKIPEGVTLPGKLGTGIDLKSNGYIMLEPSNHVSGGSYAWEASSDPRDGIAPTPLPGWICELGRSATTATGTTALGNCATTVIDAATVSDLRSALNHLPADDRDQWVSVGLALKELGNVGRGLWLDWSQTSDKYQPSDARMWGTFNPSKTGYRAVFAKAQAAGWTNPKKGITPSPMESVEAWPEHRPNPGVDMSGLLTRFASPSAEWLDSEPVPAAARTVPAHILQLPGVMGECMDWMTRTAIRPQPVLSMVATLSLFATALARKVATPTMLRTNMYFVSVAGTGAGKEHGRKCLAKALDAAGLGDLVGGDGVASGAGLLSRVTAQPRTVFQIDEFGMMLQTLRSKNAGTHLATIIPNLMKLFGLTDGTYRGTEYADKGLKPRLEIPYPCVNLHATTTPNEFFPALASGDVTSGALNRMLVVFAPEGRVKTQKPTREAYPPAGVTEWLKAAQRMGCGLQGLAADSPLIVEYADGAEAIMEDFTDWIDALSDDGDSDATELWQRAWEHAAKLGLIHSLACLDSEELQARASGDSLRISCESTEWAISLTKHFMAQMQRDIAERVGDSEFDVLVKNVMRVVRGGGRKGCTHSELVKLSRGYKAKEPRVQEQVMLAITRAEDAKLVSVESPSGRGRPRLAYVAIEHLPPDFE